MKSKATQMKQKRQNAGNSNAEPRAKPVNTCPRDRSGTTFGLYQRFYWDAGNVPIGGYPHFQNQGPRGAGIGVSSTKRTKSANGGKFTQTIADKPKQETAGPGTYFMNGRSEIKISKYSRFAM